MGKIDKIYVRKIRDDLGRYPTWPLSYPIELGMIGYYHGKSASFEWIDSLKNLGINISPTNPQKLMDEMYCSNNSVRYEFNTSEKNTGSNVTFNFKRNKSIASQGHDFEYQNLPMDKLSKELLKKIKDGLEWNTKWVVVTEIWITKGFTALISGSAKSLTEISASVPVKREAFNIANPDLGLSISKSHEMGYQGVAKPGIRPFFQVHRLINDKRVGWYLKKYGKNSIFFPDIIS